MSQQPKVLKDNLILYNTPFFENTAKVIVPGASAPMGKIVLNLGQPRDQAGLVARDLLDATGTFAANATANKVPYLLDLTTQINATDNQIIRLQDGSLLASKNGYTWGDVTPQPEWFDTGRFQYGANLFSSGDVYVSGHGDGGPYTLNGKTTENHAGVIFRSTDNGKTWDPDPVYVFDGSRPYLMTSTPDHRLVVFHIRNDVPTLYYTENGVMSAARDVTASDGKNLLTFKEDSELGDITGGLHPCLARFGRYGDWDRAWIAYPSLNASGRQIYVVATVTFGGTVYDDMVDPDNQNTDPSCTLFYWVEAKPSTSTASDKDNLLVRYQIFHSGQALSPGYLSVQNGARRYFGRGGIGDYFSGGYFWMGNELNFLAQWNEPDGIKGNIVSLPPFPQIKVHKEFIDLIILPYPDPALRELIDVRLRVMSIAQRRHFVTRLKLIQSYVNEALKELNDPSLTENI